MPTPSPIHSHIRPRDVRPFGNFNAQDFRDLAQLGIQLPERTIDNMLNVISDGIGMDAFQGLITTATIPAAIQFLQTWLPGFVRTITQARKIDQLVGITTAGAWEDEEIVQGFLEPTGSAVPYGDYTNVPLSSWNPNFLTRTVVRFEEGMQVAILEDARASRMKISSAAEKRAAAATALEIQRNNVGFFGYNGGDNLTYGYLNDPFLPAYVTVPNGATGTPQWSTKTFQEITKDLRTAFAKLRTQSGDTIDPSTQPIMLALSTQVIDQLSVTTDFGQSVMDWLKRTYPQTTVVSAPELNGANAGANVFYLYAESSNDGSTDDGRTFMHINPVKFRTLGVQQKIKTYEEDYSNATAGVFLKRPINVVRYSGV